MAKNLRIVPNPTGSTPYILFENESGDKIQMNVNDDGSLSFSGATNGNDLFKMDANAQNIRVGKDVDFTNDIYFDNTLTMSDDGQWVGKDLGVKGNLGDVGPQGEQGEKGLKGYRGGQGPLGPQGPQGDDFQGSTGPQGIQGPAGEDNTKGPKGLKGRKGSQTKGQKGPQGNSPRGGQGGQGSSPKGIPVHL